MDNNQKTLDWNVAKQPIGFRQAEEGLFGDWDSLPKKRAFVCPYCLYQTRKHEKGSAFIRVLPDGNLSFSCFFCHKTAVIFKYWWGKKK